MIAVALGITPLHFSIYQALPDRLFGYFLIVIPLFLLLFAGHTDGFMIDHGEDSWVGGRQFTAAPLTL